MDIPKSHVLDTGFKYFLAVYPPWQHNNQNMMVICELRFLYSQILHDKPSLPQTHHNMNLK